MLRRSRVLSLLLKGAAIAGCLYYVLDDVDIHGLLGRAAALSPLGIALFLLLMVVSYGVHGYRLYQLTGARVSLLDATKCFCLGQGVNYVMPSKLGEMAKVLFLNKVSGLPGSAATEIVFWERFFDINCLVILVLFCLSKVAGSAAVISLAIVWGGLWLMLVVIRVAKLPLLEKLCTIVPTTPARRFVFDLIKLIRRNLTVGFFTRQAFLGVLTWALNCLHAYLFYRVAGGLDLAATDLLYVFVISTLGYAVPAAPGGIGLYEAAIVFGLGAAGVPKDVALSLALVQHLIMFAVALAGLGYVLLTTKLHFADLLPNRIRREVDAKGRPHEEH